MPSRATLANYLRYSAADYAKSFLGEPIPYHWGGQDPLGGFDCSGFVITILQGVGIFPLNQDTTADGLYSKWKKYKVDGMGWTGCLAFWLDRKKKEEAFHVEIMVDRHHVIGASGGARTTDTIQEAIRNHAFIKQRNLKCIGGNIVIVDPFMEVLKNERLFEAVYGAP